MKKALSIFLSLFLVLALLGCPSTGNSKYSIKAEGSTTLGFGDTLQLTLTPAVEGVTWLSDSTFITVDMATGLVTVLANLPGAVELPHTATITAYDVEFNELASLKLVVDELWADKAAKAEAQGKAVTLTALNCRENLSFDEKGVLTNMAKEGAISNTADAYAYVVYPVNVTKDSSLRIKGKVYFGDASSSNGPALIIHNGTSCVAYRATTSEGVKNVVVSTCPDMLKTGGNGYSYYSGYSKGGLTKQDLYAEVSVENGQATMNLYDAKGGLIATKSNNFSDYFKDGAVVNLAFGGNQTDKMLISDIHIIEDGVDKLVTKIDNGGLAGLSVEETKIRVKLGETANINVLAVNAGNTAAEVMAVSKDASKVSVSVAKPNSDKISVVTVRGESVGTTTVTVTHKDSPNLSRAIEVSVDDFTNDDVYSAENLSMYPAIGATDAPIDGWYRLSFDDEPGLLTGGAIMIYKAVDNSLADTILYSDEKLNVWDGLHLGVRDQLVKIEGKNLYFMPHYEVLEYDTEYYVAIPRAAVSGTLDGDNFYENGLSNVAKTWSFKTRSAPILDTEIAVDSSENATADFRSIHNALRAVKDRADETITLKLAEGTYNELVYYKGKANIILEGPTGNDRGDNCLITWNNYEKMNSGTHNRAQFYFNGANLTLKNVYFNNKFRRSVTEQDGQAECIYFAGGNDRKLVAYNCSFYSFQDTIQSTGRNWFYDCYIAGDVDFLWGTADAALFENCDLHSINDEIRSTKTADLLVPRVANKAATIIPKGYVVFNCTLTVDEGIKQSFGRVAGAGDFYDQCAVINTKVLGAGLIETIWNNGTAPVGLPKVNNIQHVGWKDYGVTVNGSAVNESTRCAKDFCGTITKEVYDAEYSSRDVILNRVFNTQTNSYQLSANGTWDLSSYYAEFGITD